MISWQRNQNQCGDVTDLCCGFFRGSPVDTVMYSVTGFWHTFIFIKAKISKYSSLLIAWGGVLCAPVLIKDRTWLPFKKGAFIFAGCAFFFLCLLRLSCHDWPLFGSFTFWLTVRMIFFIFWNAASWHMSSYHHTCPSLGRLVGCIHDQSLEPAQLFH